MSDLSFEFSGGTVNADLHVCYGDENDGAGIGSNHSFARAGVYDATLMVTDDAGSTSQFTQGLEVTETPTVSITLFGRPIVQGRHKRALLAWSGATTQRVDIYVGGRFAGQTKNDGYHIRHVPRKAKSVTD